MLLTIDNLCKVYRGRVRANDGISLSVAAGEVFGLLGHNGAGKTTLLNQVVGLSRPTSGAIRIDGRDPVADPDTARRMCSLQPQAQAPLDGITPRQAIRLMARIRGANRRRACQRGDELLAALDLEPWADTVGQKLSGGVRRLTAFCMAAAFGRVPAASTLLGCLISDGMRRRYAPDRAGAIGCNQAKLGSRNRQNGCPSGSRSTRTPSCGWWSARVAPASSAHATAASRLSAPMSRWSIICCASTAAGHTGGVYCSSNWNSILRSPSGDRIFAQPSVGGCPGRGPSRSTTGHPSSRA
jgi:ABC-type transport system involved in cytochrome c biogenesis ATPase subunit